MNSFVANKLRHAYIWRKIFYERLTEPVHLNVMSAFVAVFGSFRAKVLFDLIVRPQHAFAILKCADEAKRLGLNKVTLLEFGVASGAGLLNICSIAARATRTTGVDFEIIGFDSGSGLPPPQSYRDHPDLYQEGDYPMDHNALASRLPSNARLVIGDIAQTVSRFLEQVNPRAPIGFVSFDVDYYSSTKDALHVFDAAAELYLPKTIVYMDDIQLESHNRWCGQLLALDEFNREHELRKIEHHTFLKNNRVFRNASWLNQIYTLHVLDHPTRTLRSAVQQPRQKQVIENPYSLSRPAASVRRGGSDANLR